MKEWLKTEEGKKATPEQIRKQFIKQASNQLIDVDIDSISVDEYSPSEFEGILPAIGTYNPIK